VLVTGGSLGNDPQPGGTERSRMRVPTLVLVLVTALAASTPVLAGDIVVTIGLMSGGLSLQAPAAVASASRAVNIPLLVADGRGTGAGWTLRVNSAKPVKVTSITARCAAGSTCTLPTASTAANGQMILSASRNTGMGVIALVVTVAPLGKGAAGVPVSFSVA